MNQIRIFSPILKKIIQNTSARELHLQKHQKRCKIDGKTICLLERLSLVDCGGKKGIQILESSIQYADQILQIDVTNNEPLVTVLEDKPLLTREDKVIDGNCKKAILKIASLTEDGYFVTPFGNLILDVEENKINHSDK